MVVLAPRARTHNMQSLQQEFCFTGASPELGEFSRKSRWPTGNRNLSELRCFGRTGRCHRLLDCAFVAAVFHTLVSVCSSNAHSLNHHQLRRFHQPEATTPQSTHAVSASPFALLHTHLDGPTQQNSTRKTFSPTSKFPFVSYPKKWLYLPATVTDSATPGVPKFEVLNGKNNFVGHARPANHSTPKKGVSSACLFSLGFKPERNVSPFRHRRSAGCSSGIFPTQASAFTFVKPSVSPALLERRLSQSSLRMKKPLSPLFQKQPASDEAYSLCTRLHFSSCKSGLEGTTLSHRFWKRHYAIKNCVTDLRCDEAAPVATSRSHKSTWTSSPNDNCHGSSPSRCFAFDPSGGLLSAAPMMDYTNRHWRRLISLMSRRLTLYTEMVPVPPAPCESLDSSQDLPFSVKRKLLEEAGSLASVPNDVVLQVGVGSAQSATAVARVLNEFSVERDHAEPVTRMRGKRTFLVNLNCGCPSPRVAKGSFGLILMEDPKRVAEMCQILVDGANNREGQKRCSLDVMGKSARGNTKDRTVHTNDSPETDSVAVSVKCRVGIEEDKQFLRSGSSPISRATTPYSSSSCTYDKLAEFVGTVVETSPVRHFIIHARPGILVGKLSPKQNLQIPQRRPEWVYRLCSDFPTVSFTFNGGVKSFQNAEEHLLNTNDKLAGIMVGRDMLERPWYWGSHADAFITAQEQRRGMRSNSTIEGSMGKSNATLAGDNRRKVKADLGTVEVTVSRAQRWMTEPCETQRIMERVTRAEVLERYACYVDEVEKTDRLRCTSDEQETGRSGNRKATSGGQMILNSRASLLKPLLNMFAGEPGSRAFKQRLQAACGNPESFHVGQSESSDEDGLHKGRGEVSSGEYSRQVVASNASGLRFPRQESTGEIIRQTLEVIPTGILHSQPEWDFWHAGVVSFLPETVKPT
ncbi:dihydrouridine synthase (dus) protein [Toxoplasma gondii MAS]|uniref:Dihydrouridine synthase (Dus) protein n=1 Tax=Toxoplasma gondii MAS TaxID=943118 RepID=A0A086QWL9_TOXGO|nr:dihydrouridine synthase (dus) protein [Toxoplasma gondii MAS]